MAHLRARCHVRDLASAGIPGTESLGGHGAEGEERGEEADVSYEAPMGRARAVKAGTESPRLHILVSVVIGHP